MLTRSLNLGILAHVDAGKTTLTERLLHLAGVIDEPGSVDSGTTQTDTLDARASPRHHHQAAVVAFPLDDLTVNVVDTPGHPDFIAEVERVARRARRGGARAVRRRGRPAADPDPDARAAAAPRPDAAVRQQGRPDRRRRRRRPGGGPAKRLSPDILPMGAVHGAGTAAADVHGVPARRRRLPRAARRRCSPSTTTPSSRRTSRGATVRPRQLRRRGRRPDPQPGCCTRCTPARPPPAPGSPS